MNLTSQKKFAGNLGENAVLVLISSISVCAKSQKHQPFSFAQTNDNRQFIVIMKIILNSWISWKSLRDSWGL